MSKSEAREKARGLRAEGKSVREISKQLGVSSGSVSCWVRDVLLTDKQRTELSRYDRGNRATGRSDKARECREVAFRHGYERAVKDEQFRLLSMLYWGEGDKGGRKFRVANCDPAMLRIVFRWLQEEGHDDHATFTVMYHAENGISEESIKRWWMSKIPGLCKSHFRKFAVKDTSGVKNKQVGKVPYGTGYLTVNRTELAQQVLGGIQYLSE